MSRGALTSCLIIFDTAPQPLSPGHHQGVCSILELLVRFERTCGFLRLAYKASAIGHQATRANHERVLIGSTHNSTSTDEAHSPRYRRCLYSFTSGVAVSPAIQYPRVRLYCSPHSRLRLFHTIPQHPTPHAFPDTVESNHPESSESCETFL